MYTRALRQINIYTPNTRKYTHTEMILSLMRIYTYIFFVFFFAFITGPLLQCRNRRFKEPASIGEHETRVQSPSAELQISRPSDDPIPIL